MCNIDVCHVQSLEFNAVIRKGGVSVFIIFIFNTIYFIASLYNLTLDNGRAYRPACNDPAHLAAGSWKLVL